MSRTQSGFTVGGLLVVLVISAALLLMLSVTVQRVRQELGEPRGSRSQTAEATRRPMQPRQTARAASPKSRQQRDAKQAPLSRAQDGEHSLTSASPTGL
jgi:hypothetical protein